MIRNLSFEGIVIKRTNLGEADRLLTVFTQEQGKVVMLAKGVRKISSRRGGNVELFNLMRGQIVATKGDLAVLGEVEVVRSFENWRKYLGRVTLAYQLCEVVDKMTGDGQSHPKVYAILKTALTNLGNLGGDWKIQMDRWLLAILVDLGFWSDSHTMDGDLFEYVERIMSRRMYSRDFLLKLH